VAFLTTIFSDKYSVTIGTEDILLYLWRI